MTAVQNFAAAGRGLIAWLESAGWSVVDETRGLTTLADEESGIEVLISTLFDAPDAADINRSAIRQLGSVEDLSSGQIVSLAQLSVSPAIELIAGADIAGFSQAYEIQTAVGDALSAAAWATSGGPRAVLRGPRPRTASEFMDSVRVGHTIPGSYRIPLFVDDVEVSGDSLKPGVTQQLGIEEESFASRTLKLFSRASRAAIGSATLVRDGAASSAFSNAVADGTTANLCSALSRAGIAAAGQWTMHVSVSGRRLDYPREVLEGSLAEPLEEGARYLRGTDDGKLIEVVGPVEHLDRPEDEDSGTIGIRFENRLYYVDLARDRYEMALDAHKDKQIIAIAGTLRRYGRRTHIEDIQRMYRLTESLGF